MQAFYISFSFTVLSNRSEFGDITKNVLSQTGKVVTGKEDYVFGDITRGVLNDMENSLKEWRGQAFNELPVKTIQQILDRLDKQDRYVLFVSSIRLLAVALLTWGLFANICTALTISACWAKASLTSAVRGCWNPFRSSAHMQRQVFLSTYTYARIVLDPLFLVLQGAGTVLTVHRYQRFVANIESRWITDSQRTTYPLLHRVAALFLAFLTNTAITVGLTALGVGFGTMLGQTKLMLIHP